SDELKTNREKIDVSEVDQRKKQIINELITENRRLLKEIISLINLNLEVVESLKSMLDEKTGIYKIVDGKLVEE
ncbi:MAG: hypothetical protein NZO16_07785, partial [Deltaproteobacteria bacterium]|nr:hypothetical protein [Deltaproteobacteria bacterium]